MQLQFGYERSVIQKQKDREMPETKQTPASGTTPILSPFTKRCYNCKHWDERNRYFFEKQNGKSYEELEKEYEHCGGCGNGMQNHIWNLDRVKQA